MSDRQSHKNLQASELGKKVKWLPADAVARVERKIEDHFHDWTVDLVTNERWSRCYNSLNTPSPLSQSSKHRLRELLLVIWEFGGDYAKLLERAALEHANEIGKLLLQKSHVPLRERECNQLWDASLLFVRRFTEDKYERPWDGFFMLPSADSGELPDQRTFRVDFQRVNPLARLFRDAEERATTQQMTEARRTSENPQGDYFDFTSAGRKRVSDEFSSGMDSSGWNDRAANRAENEFQILRLQTIGDRRTRANLTVREKKILEVALRGSKGLTYFRELNNAGIGPLRTGVWKECPAGTYPAAYQLGEPWRHRIQDEKYKIWLKGGLTKLAERVNLTLRKTHVKPA